MTLHVRLSSRLGGIFLAVLATMVAGCADNPVTGRDQLFLISRAQEAEIGAQQNPEIIRAFGGTYDDPELLAYVERVGRRLVAGTERPDAPFTFTVLDSEIVNAFALPGGYVYVTRGLLALANSEAELASVLAHEISHVTARHPAERYSQAALAQLGIGLIGAVTGSNDIAGLAGVGAQAYLTSYSRDQEREADAIGIRYLSAAGYDPSAMARFLVQMERHGELHALVTGTETAPAGFFSTHPRTTERVIQAARIASAFPGGGVRKHAEYLAAIDGMIYGEGAGGAQLRGRTYADPARGFRWDAPPGYRLRRIGDTVLADGPADSGIVFDTVAVRGAPPVGFYLTSIWADGAPLDHLERIDVNGYPAATGVIRLDTEAGPRDFRLLAIGTGPGRFARFVFITRPGTTDRLAMPLQRATYSFRPMGPVEASSFRPLRLKTITVAPGDTVEDLARRMPFDDHRVERFLTLNGLDAFAPLEAGREVKLVVR